MREDPDQDLQEEIIRREEVTENLTETKTDLTERQILHLSRQGSYIHYDRILFSSTFFPHFLIHTNIFDSFALIQSVCLFVT